MTRRTRFLLGGSVVVVIALTVLWQERRQITHAEIDRLLASRGVAARYVVRDIGFGSQRFERVSIGDPDHPDLTADWVETQFSPTLSSISLTSLRASGLRLRATLTDKGVTLGALDKLLPKSTGGGFALPEIDTDLRDVRVALATKAGPVTLRLDGQGRLSNGFHGVLSARADHLSRGTCVVNAAKADLSVTVRSDSPRLTGPVRANSVGCGSAQATGLQAAAQVAFGSSFKTWAGSTRVRADRVEAPRLTLTAVSVNLAVKGGMARSEIAGVVHAHADNLYDLAADDLAVMAQVQLADRQRQGQGRIALTHASAGPATLRAMTRAMAALAGTPIAPLAQAFDRAATRAAINFAAVADGRLTTSGNDLRLAIDTATLRSKSGVVGVMRGGPALNLTPRARALNMRINITGGGLPAVDAIIARPVGGQMSARVDVAPYAAGNARMALTPIMFAGNGRDGVDMRTQVRIDGPVVGGRVEGLAFALVGHRSADGTMTISPGCTPVAFDTLATSDVQLGRSRVVLCPLDARGLAWFGPHGMGGAARTDRVALVGTVGGAPLTLTLDRGSVRSGGSITADGLAVRLGMPDRMTQLDVAHVDGTLSPTPRGGFGGRFARLAGVIGGVPLDLSSRLGRWSVVAVKGGGDAVELAGDIRVSDTAAVPRFEPLTDSAASLTVRQGIVSAHATLTEPKSQKAVTAVDLIHDLGSGRGHAGLQVRDLFFGKSLQPEAITPLTLGLVANVQGSISGDGTIDWTRDKVTSGGRFSTDSLDFAAAFGPVSGLSGTVVFDDLLALTTPAGQVVHLALVNPGTEVKDGTITYRLLADRRVAVETGHWPFAGGDLSLDPATLDFGQRVVRRLTFRLTALDAARFVEQLKLQDLAATGLFDGTLPIEFDETGARIVGGHIVARPGGGRLAYVGDVSNQQTNAYSKLAFDALKSIRYDNLAIDLDGALDGDIVSQVRFTGTNQSAVAPTGLLKSFTGLPFKFNITVRAPFRGLVDTARGLQDPSVLLDKPVQPPASAAKP